MEEGTRSESERVFVKAYDFASSCDLRAARQTLEAGMGGRVLESDPLLVQFDNTRMVAVFDYGAGGFFNAPVQGYITQDTVEGLEQPFPKMNNMLLITLNGDTSNHASLESSAQMVRNEVKDCNVGARPTAQRAASCGGAPGLAGRCAHRYWLISAPPSG